MLLTEMLKNVRYSVYKDRDISDTEAMQIAYDSRKAFDGYAFFCLVGANMDGHDFVRSAYGNGCRIFICSKEVELPDDTVIILVDDTRNALAVTSAEFFGNPADKLTIIGVTGTKGKTTTTLLVYNILNSFGMKCAYIGSNGITVNNETVDTVNTTPESYELHKHFSRFVKLGVQYVAMEVSSQAAKTDRIYGIRFDLCVFLNLSEDHICEGEHHDFDDYKSCKKKLFSDYGCKNIIYNADDPHSLDIISGINASLSSFGITNPADLNASNINSYRSSGVIGVEFDCATGQDSEPIHVKMRSPGDFSVYNGLAAMMICRHLGVEYSDSASVLEKTSVKGRFEIVDALPYCTFVIDYAHNEISLSKVLDVLKKYNPKRLICVFGSVGGRVEARRAELGMVASELADYCIVTSDNPNYEEPMKIIRDIVDGFTRECPYSCVSNREMAVRNAVQMAEEGDIILFAGKGHETYQLIDGVKVPFSEKTIIEREAEKLLEIRAFQ